MKFYALDPLVRAYLADHPQMTPEEAEEAARALRRLLHAMDRQWSRSNQRFRRKHVLVSPEFLQDPFPEDEQRVPVPCAGRMRRP